MNPAPKIATTPITATSIPASKPQTGRRRWVATLAGLGAWWAVPATQAAAQKASPVGDEPRHKLVYQLNRAEPEYQEAIFNSVSAMLKKYVDDVALVVVVWGPGIHLLAKQPKRPVAATLQQRARSMAEAYGVRFVACGNTMHTVGWTQADMLNFAEVEEVGAAAIMELQEKGYAYLAW